MIFVTTGTDHHSFDRLVTKVDLLRGRGIIDEEVFIQKGSSRYVPKFCAYADFVPFDQVMEKIKKAKIIITHGGPGSIMPVIYTGKIPIVVPRRRKHGEAVDDHQVDFVKKLEEKGKILSVDKIQEIEYKIKNYHNLVQRLQHEQSEEASSKKRISRFAHALETICKRLMEK